MEDALNVGTAPTSGNATANDSATMGITGTQGATENAVNDATQNATAAQGGTEENTGTRNLQGREPLSEEQRKDLSPDWREQLPESVRELAKDFESKEAFADALKRGAAHKPALTPEELEYVPEGVEMDPAAARQFRELGVKIGLTAEQARALVDFEAQAVAERARKNAEEGLAFLKQKWGAEYEDNVQHAKRALLALDNRTDGRISQLFGRDGLGSVPSLMEAFALIGRDMAEDSAAGAKSAAESGKESALGMFAGMFH